MTRRHETPRCGSGNGPASLTHTKRGRVSDNIEELEPGAWLDELKAIWKRDETLTAEAVTIAAKDPDSALYQHFTHDPQEAIGKLNLIEASRLIRRAKILITLEGGETRYVRAWLHTSSGYQPTARVMSNGAMRDEVLARMRNDIEVMSARYSRYADIPEIADAMKMLRRWLKE